MPHAVRFACLLSCCLAGAVFAQVPAAPTHAFAATSSRSMG